MIVVLIAEQGLSMRSLQTSSQERWAIESGAASR